MLKKVIAVTLIMLVALGGLMAAVTLRAPETASGEIEAIPLVLATNTAVSVAPSPEENTEATAVPAPATTASTAATATTTTVAAATETATATAVSSGELTLFRISQADSQVRFELDEDLRGSRITVVGVTNQVAGELAFNLNNLSQTQVGVIQINARTLATDNSFRNRAIQNEILQTGRYEFITFTPTAVSGLPENIAVGESVSFTIDGNLTIRDITQPATFAVQATAVSETEIQGAASAVIVRSLYNLTIPSVPNVANVEEEVELYINFTAHAS